MDNANSYGDEIDEDVPLNMSGHGLRRNPHDYRLNTQPMQYHGAPMIPQHLPSVHYNPYERHEISYSPGFSHYHSGVLNLNMGRNNDYNDGFMVRSRSEPMQQHVPPPINYAQPIGYDHVTPTYDHGSYNAGRLNGRQVKPINSNIETNVSVNPIMAEVLNNITASSVECLRSGQTVKQDPVVQTINVNTETHKVVEESILNMQIDKPDEDSSSSKVLMKDLEHVQNPVKESNIEATEIYLETENKVEEVAENNKENILVEKQEELEDKKMGLDLNENYPFLTDAHGFSIEYYKITFDKKLFSLIAAEKSHEVALKAIEEDYKDLARQDKIYQCAECVLLFRHPKRFLIHRNWHSFGKLGQEQQEKPGNMRRRSRKQNADSTLPKEEEEPVTCDVCHETYSSFKRLQQHKSRIHPKTAPKECAQCGKTFANNNYLKNHMLSHVEDKKYMCENCPKSFKFMHSLIRHRPVHMEKKFSCNECEKKFGSKTLLNIHSKCHEKVLRGTTFHCSYCGKGFYHSYNLSVHERTHRNERPFKCELCNGAYPTNSSLKRHIKVSHNEHKPFACDECHRCFTSEMSRTKHISRLHKS